MLDIHSSIIDSLIKKGADEGKMWLIEVQDINTTANLYGDYILNELENKNHDSIMYYHENGYIFQQATFDRSNKKSIEKAVNFLANHI